MTDEKEPSNIKEIPVEDFGLGLVTLLSGGLSGVLGGGGGDLGTLFGSLRAKAGAIMKKAGSGFVCGTSEKTD